MKTLTWPQVIGRRLALNYLIEPAPPDRLVDVVRTVCGIQAQVPAAAELGISARLAGVTRQDVRDAIWEKRVLVRTNGPRETQHILPAYELPLWTASLRAASSLRPTPRPRLVVPLREAKALIEILTDAIQNLTLTREEFAEKVARRGQSRAYEPLLSRWDSILDWAVSEGLVVHGPDDGNKVTYASAGQWVETWQEMDPRESLLEICRRYIGTYGPTTHSDFARWFAITPDAAREVFDSIKGELEEVKVERRRAWILAADAGASWEPVEGSLRLVPQYDCYVLDSYPRAHIVPEEFKRFIGGLSRASYDGAVGFSLLLIDGIVSGIWQRRKRGKRLDITVSPVVELSDRHRDQLNVEAERIAAFLGTEVTLAVGPPE
jgi:hypothetical protein